MSQSSKPQNLICYHTFAWQSNKINLVNLWLFLTLSFHPLTVLFFISIPSVIQGKAIWEKAYVECGLKCGFTDIFFQWSLFKDFTRHRQKTTEACWEPCWHYQSCFFPFHSIVSLFHNFPAWGNLIDLVFKTERQVSLRARQCVWGPHVNTDRD